MTEEIQSVAKHIFTNNINVGTWNNQSKETKDNFILLAHRIMKLLNLTPGEALSLIDEKATVLPKKISDNNIQILTKKQEETENIENNEPQKEIDDSFWIIWNPYGYNPRFKHNSEESAITEAERLSNNNPDSEFYILKAIHMAKTPKVKIKWKSFSENKRNKEIDEIPF